MLLAFWLAVHRCVSLPDGGVGEMQPEELEDCSKTTNLRVQRSRDRHDGAGMQERREGRKGLRGIAARFAG